MVSMANFNSYSSPIGFGVFHSGAEIYGCEYAYGGHNNSHSGVFEIAPRDVAVLGEDSFRFRETIVIGYTDFDQDDVKQIVEQLGIKFRGDKYHLLHQNCNHFTDALTKVGFTVLPCYMISTKEVFILHMTSLYLFPVRVRAMAIYVNLTCKLLSPHPDTLRARYTFLGEQASSG